MYTVEAQSKGGTGGQERGREQQRLRPCLCVYVRCRVVSCSLCRPTAVSKCAACFLSAVYYIAYYRVRSLSCGSCHILCTVVCGRAISPAFASRYRLSDVWVGWRYANRSCTCLWHEAAPNGQVSIHLERTCEHAVRLYVRKLSLFLQLIEYCSCCTVHTFVRTRSALRSDAHRKTTRNAAGPFPRPNHTRRKRQQGCHQPTLVISMLSVFDLL